MNIAIFLFLFFYLLLSLYRLDWAVLLLIASLPAYLFRFGVLGLPSTVSEGMILISFGVWFLTKTNFTKFLKGDYKIRDYLANSRKRNRYPFAIEMIALLIISFIAVAIAGFNLDALGLWRAYFFEPLLVFILIVNLFQRRQDIYRVATALSVSALVVSVFAILQKFTGWLIPVEYLREAEVNRVTSFYNYPNAVGLFVAPISLVALGLLIQKLKKVYRVYKDKIEKITKQEWMIIVVSFFATTSSWLAIGWARSEGAIVGVIVALIIFGFLYSKRVRLVFILVLLLTITFIYFYTPVRKYVVEKATLSDLSGEIRQLQWASSWKMLRDDYRWLTGVGVANYQETVASYRPEGLFFNKDNDPDFRRKIVWGGDEYKAKYWQPIEVYLYPHNIILNFWIELGILGVLLLSSLILLGQNYNYLWLG